MTSSPSSFLPLIVGFCFLAQFWVISFCSLFSLPLCWVFWLNKVWQGFIITRSAKVSGYYGCVVNYHHQSPNTIKGANGALGQSLFQGLHLTCGIHILVYSLNFSKIQAQCNIVSLIYFLNYNFIIYHTYYVSMFFTG